MPTLRASDFDFELPPGLIAQQPAARRDAARLLLVGEGPPGHHVFTELPALIEAHVGPGTLLVVNDTRVIPARLLGRKARPKGGAEEGQGGQVELLLCDPQSDRPGRPEGPGPWQETWRCLYRASKPLRPGTEILLDGERPPAATVLENQGGGRVLVAFAGDGDGGDLGGLLSAAERIGQVPLPPYIQRPRQGPPADQDDRGRYQTIFAEHPGGAAAPTAGLHFTPELLSALSARGLPHVAVTLHVGPGTFAPLRTDDLSDHVMHPERYHVPPAVARAIAAQRERGGKVLAVGTTVVRTLESATPPGEPGPRPGWGETRLFIHPPYRFHAVDALLTNFHLPRSTLLMLVSAFAGRRRVLSAYAEAVRRGYRFFSYGDAMLIPRALPDEGAAAGGGRP